MARSGRPRCYDPALPKPETNVSRLFISHQRIEKLTADNRVVLEGDRLAVPALGASFRLSPALYFKRVVSDDGDTHKLLGRVKSEEYLRRLGAEVLADSAVIGETAYQCEGGFLGEVVATGAATWTGELKQLPE